MKKILTAILVALLSLSCFTGCTSVQTSAFTGSYWYQGQYTEKTAKEGFYEKITYDVSSVDNTTEAPALIDTSDGALGFKVDVANSSYVTELYTEGGNYVYETTLTVSGTYYYGKDKGTEYKVENDVTKTKVVFKDFNSKFKPISSTKEAENTYPVIANPSKETDFRKVGYKSVIKYGDRDATVTLTPNSDPDSKNAFSSFKEPITIKKYAKKNYIDNEIVALLFRTFTYDSSLSYTFNVIENASGSFKEVTGKAKLSTTQTSSEADKAPIIPMTIKNCSLSDGAPFSAEEKFSAMGITFSTTGEFAQTYMTAYYEESRENPIYKETGHIMIKCYQPMVYNCTYMLYTLRSVSYQK